MRFSASRLNDDASAPGPDAAPSSRRDLLYLVLVVAAALAVRVWFWVATGWTIEDSFIYGRMVRNTLSHGVMSYNTGAPVSSATSPLFVLLTTCVAWTGVEPVAAAKLIGLLASTATCALVYRILRLYLPPQAALTGSTIYIFLPPVIAYSVGGMETGLYTLAVCWAFERLLHNRIAGAVLLSTTAAMLRPDGAILLVVVGASVIWRLRSDLRRLLLMSLMSGALLAAFYLAHRAYYGSFVAQSVVAKGGAYGVDVAANCAKYLKRMLFSQPGGVVIYVLALWGLWRKVRPNPALWLPVVWYVLYLGSFIGRAPLFDWYLQPPLVVLCILAGLGLADLTAWADARIGASAGAGAFTRAGAAAVCAALLASTVLYAHGRIVVQRDENAVRAAAGKWLASNTSPDDLVFTESLGYIGYQTRNTFVDWPGLTSRQVPTVLRSSGVGRNRRKGYDAVIRAFHPRYLVLRDGEWARLAQNLKARYVLRASFPPPNSSGPEYVIAAEAPGGRM